MIDKKKVGDLTIISGLFLGERVENWGNEKMVNVSNYLMEFHNGIFQTNFTWFELTEFYAQF